MSPEQLFSVRCVFVTFDQARSGGGGVFKADRHMLEGLYVSLLNCFGVKMEQCIENLTTFTGSCNY